MNKIITIGIILLLFFPIVSVKAKQRDIVEIKERMFATQVSDIYLNSGDYLGKTIKLEGIFKQYEFYGEEPVNIVFRYAPGGCCGGDGQLGFEVKWAKDNIKQYPIENSWVEVIGVLKEEELDFNKYMYIELSSLLVLNRRGTEFVRR